MTSARGAENDAAKKKARREREAKERALLRKELDDFVKKHVAAGTAAGRGYEREVKKRQDAIDEHYAGTIAGLEAARRQRKMKEAAAESAKLETQIQKLRAAPGHRSREKERKLEKLEEQLQGLRKRARGVLVHNEVKAAKKRSEATKAVAELRRKLAKARRDARAGQAKLVEELGKELAKAERKVAKLEANDRRKEELDGLSSRLDAVVARINPGTALAREAETCCTALTACRRLTRLDTSAELEALGAAVVAVEEAQRGGGKVRADVERALEAVEPGGSGFGRKRRLRKEVSDSASR